MSKSKKTLKIKTVKKPVKKPLKAKAPVKAQVKTLQPTLTELKKAYRLVTKDLFNRLIKAKDEEKVTIGALGALGSLIKRERKVKSGIVPFQKGRGKKVQTKLNTYVYYHLRFKPSRKLKLELNKPLVKKYS